MTEPVAWRKKYSGDKKWRYEETGYIGDWDVVERLYTAEQLHPRVKMTQAEFDEFKKLLSVGISTIYEAFDVIDSDRGETDEFEQLYNRLFTNGVNEQAKNQIEFSKLWDSLSTSSEEETIEIVPNMKWFFQRNDTKDRYRFLSKDIVTSDNEFNYSSLKYSAKQFDTKEEAEEWKNPLTEVVLLSVEGDD